MEPGGFKDRFAASPTTNAALAFASARHAGQYREVDRAPFIAHPIEVAGLLRRDGHPDHVIAAGLLHDLLEKTATTDAELNRRFGRRIARLVATVSDDPSIGSYEERKRDLRDRVARSDSEALAVYAADKIAKVREQAMRAPSRRHDSTTRAKLAHYRASLDMLRRVAGDAALVQRLDVELAQLTAPATTELIVTRAPRPALALIAPTAQVQAS
jgi:(p)ppGpp synthase/HD superfamily hydrolase